MARLFFVSSALLFSLTPQALRSAPNDRSVVFGQSTPIVDLGPAYAAFQHYPAGYEAALAVYDRLVSFDSQLRIQPQLALRWESSTDGRSTTFTLRRGVRFHDGTPLNAEAVKFNIDRMIDPTINTTNRPLWDPVVDAEVLEEYTVRIRSTRSSADLLRTLAHGSGALVSPTAIRMRGQRSMARHPVGAGPFLVESFTPGQKLILRAFDLYWGGRPKVENLVFRYLPDSTTRIAALRSGAVDVIDAVPVHLVATLSRDPRLRLRTVPSLRPMGLAILTIREPLSNPVVRQALNHAIPTEVIAERVFMGQARPADAPLARQASGYSPQRHFEFSPPKARELLRQAGLSDRDGDGVVEWEGRPVTLRMLTSEGVFPKDSLVTQIAAHALREIGIDIRLVKVERGAYWDALRTNARDLSWDLALFGFNPSNGSGYYHLSSMFLSNPSDQDRPAVWNIARFRDSRVDALLQQAVRAKQSVRQDELLRDAQALIWNQAPYVWMYVDDVVSAYRQELLGVEVSPVSFTDVRNAHY